MEGERATTTQAMRELPRYKCHKEVWALKIKEIKQAPADQECCNAGGDWYLVPEDEGYAPIMVGHNAYYAKFNPHVGGYYVVYTDGYKSFSPAKPFEEGYALVGSVVSLTDGEWEWINSRKVRCSNCGHLLIFHNTHCCEFCKVGDCKCTSPE